MKKNIMLLASILPFILLLTSCSEGEKGISIILLLIFVAILIFILYLIVTNSQRNSVKKQFEKEIDPTFLEDSIGSNEHSIYFDNNADKILAVAFDTENSEKLLIENIHKTKTYHFLNNFIVFDDKNSQIAHIYIKMPNISKILFSYEDIISVEIIEDGDITYKKSTIRTIGGTIVGGVLLGGTGAIVGGLSGSSKEKKSIKSVKIKLLLRNVSNPSHIITVYDGVELNSKEPNLIYNLMMSFSNSVRDTISVIIDKTDKQAKTNQSIGLNKEKNETENSKIILSIGDELSKLAELKMRGLLTDEEFQQQKERLLHL